MDRLSVRGGAGRSSTATAGARLSPVPGAGNGVSFPTVLEEPTGYAGDEGGRGHHRFVENGFSSSHHHHQHHHHHGDLGGEKSHQQSRAQHWRRPLMCGDLSEHGRNNRSSRSFDSGMSYLVPESASPSPPPPPQISSHGDHNLFHGIPEPMGSPLLSGGGNAGGGGGRYSNFLTTPSANSPSTTSPITPPMRSPHRLYSTTILQRSFSTTCPQPPPPPLSPTFKSRSFVSRRLSDNVTPSTFTSALCHDPYSPMLRTLSPTISRSSTVSASKSPSPCFSSRSSPIQQRKRNNSSPHNSSASSAPRPGSGGSRGILAASSSLHSNDSEDGGSSPQNALSPTAMIGSSASPSTPTPTTSSTSSCSYLRGGTTGRRMLPETPKMSSLEFPVSPSSSSSATLTAPKQLHSSATHFGPPISERNLAWQSLPSRDSLDSGVYSRSTTSDSNNGGGSSSRGAMTSPSNGRDPSPPSFMRQQFRRIGARLPDPPVTAITTSASAAAATQIPSLIGSSALERRKSAPPNKSSDLFATAASSEDGVNRVSERGSNVAAAVPGTSSPHRAFSRHYYHYSCYAADAGKGSSTAHLRDAGFSPIGARGHRVHFNTFMDGAGAGAKETEEPKVIPGREGSGDGGGAGSSPLLSPSSLKARLQIAQGNSVFAETPAHCDYDDVGEPEIDDGIVETHELSAMMGAAVTMTTEELFYTNTEEDEELLADVDDDDDAFFVKDDDGYSLANPLAPSPPPEALKNSSNREIAQVVNRRIRAMLTQDYSSADVAPEEELPSHSQPIIAAAALDVPKLRDLKSHSFPPPWSRLTEEDEEEGVEDADATAAYGNGPEQRQPFGPLVIADPFFMGSDAAAARLADTCPSPGGESPQAEERRRRWLLHNHAVSCSDRRGVNGDGVAGNKEEEGEKESFDAAIVEAHQG